MRRLPAHAVLPTILLTVLGCTPALAQQAAQPSPGQPTHTKTNQTKPTPAKPVVPSKPTVPSKPPIVKPRSPASGTRANAPPKTPVPAPLPAPEPEKPAEPTKGSNTGDTLPRFAALRTDDVNLRTGPGTRYPIDWVYKRRDLPVLIEREFEVWRLVRDPDGTKGWVHQATLAPRRSGIVLAAPNRTAAALRANPNDTAAPIAELKPGVILRLRTCEATSDWCQASVQDYRGWIKRSDVWGVFPGEAIQ